ncbi:hypothetical protein Tco_1250287 [Tanacetum coccineum]
MEKELLSPKGKRSGKGVNEKQSSLFYDPSKVNNSANVDYGTSTNANKNIELNDVNDPLVNLLDKSNGTLNIGSANLEKNLCISSSTSSNVSYVHTTCFK